MGQTALNDVTYNFEPLELCIPDPNYKVNEADLQKSIQKSQEFISFIQDYKKRKRRRNEEVSAGWEKQTILRNFSFQMTGNSGQMKKILSQGTADCGTSADYRRLDKQTACLPQVTSGKKKNGIGNTSFLSWKDTDRKKLIAGRKRRAAKQ